MANKGPSSQSYGFSSSHVWMWMLDHKEGWAQKTWCFLTIVPEKTLESPLGSKEIKQVNPKGSQLWIFIVWTNAEAEVPILWSPDMESWLTGKDPDAGKVWRQEEKGMTEGETVGWHHWFKGHEFEQTPGDSEGQRSLMCCSPRGPNELDMTEQQHKVHKRVLHQGKNTKESFSCWFTCAVKHRQGASVNWVMKR